MHRGGGLAYAALLGRYGDDGARAAVWTGIVVLGALASLTDGPAQTPTESLNY